MLLFLIAPVSYFFLYDHPQTDRIRGEQDTCSPNPGAITTSPAASHTYHSAVSPASTNDTELDNLRARIAELEAELTKRRQSSSPVGRGDGRPGAVESVGRTGSGTARERPDTHTPDTASRYHAAPALPTPEEEGSDPDAKHAASILEFLSWGRKKNPDYHDVSLQASEVISNPSDVRDVDAGVAFPEVTQDWFKSQLGMIQTLLPFPEQVWALEQYHATSLLWYHGSYHAPTFRRQLRGFYDRFNGNIMNPGVNLQWVAMLFSVLTGSMTAAPDALALSWGFDAHERGVLSRQWYRAIIKLLNLAEYTANQSILSTQAIATATISAHILGFSNMQSVHLAASNKIAQGLGLHKLNRNCSGTAVEVEAGRRVWCQLLTQDWFSIPFSESYLVSPLHNKSLPPHNCHDNELVALPDTVPTVMLYSRFLLEVAAIMPQLQDDLAHASTDHFKYAVVRKWDEHIRCLMWQEAPPMLTGSVPIDPSWPIYTSWARRALIISGNHKIIMVHRGFLSESFTNPDFAYTRQTCLTSSKAIINEYKMVVEEDGPTLWIHQAFAVAASIILVLDIVHRSPYEMEFVEHRILVEDTLSILRLCKNSMIALRGEKLLAALLAEVSRSATELKKRKQGEDGLKQPRGMNVSAFVKRFCETLTLTNQTAAVENVPAAYAMTGATLDGSQHTMPLEQALTGADGMAMLGYQPMFITGVYENLEFLANSDVSFRL